MESLKLPPKVRQRIAALHKAMNETPQAVAYHTATATAMEMLGLDPATQNAMISFETGQVTVQEQGPATTQEKKDPKVTRPTLVESEKAG